MRKEFKKVVAITAAAASIVSATATAFAFTDTDTHWAKDYIDYASASGWVNGYDDGTFRPDQNITRAEVAQILVNMYDVTEVTDQVLSDVSDSAWYADAAKKAVAAGYFQGDENEGGTVVFRPEDDLTRQEAFVLIKRAAYPEDVATSTVLPFTDADSVASWAVIATSTLVEIGRLNGYEDGTIRPLNNITRAELTKLLATVTDQTPASNTTPNTVVNSNTGTSSLIGSGGSTRRSSGGGGGGLIYIENPTTAPTATVAPGATTTPTAVPTQAPTASPKPTLSPAQAETVEKAVASAAPDVAAQSKIFDDLVAAAASGDTTPEAQEAVKTVQALADAGIKENPATVEDTGNVETVKTNTATNEEVDPTEVEPILTPVYNYVLEEATRANLPGVDTASFTNELIIVVDAAANKACQTQNEEELTDYVKTTIKTLVDAKYDDDAENALVWDTVKDIVLDVFDSEMTESVAATEADKDTDVNWLTLREAFLKTTIAKDAKSVDTSAAALAKEAAYLGNFGVTEEDVIVVEE